MSEYRAQFLQDFPRTHFFFSKYRYFSMTPSKEFEQIFKIQETKFQ